MALAKELGLTEYPALTGGCLLTEPNYSCRLKELLDHCPDPVHKDIYLLRVGRHFRYSDCKIIVGRDKHENEIILSTASDDDCTMHVPGFGSPVTFVTGNPKEEILSLAASLCARYSSARKLSDIEVSVLMKGKKSVLKVRPANDYVIDKYRIVQNKDQKILT